MSHEVELKNLATSIVGYRENLQNKESTIYYCETLTRNYTSFVLERTGPGKDLDGPALNHIGPNAAFKWIALYAPEQAAKVHNDLSAFSKLGCSVVVRELRRIYNEKKKGIL